MEFIQIKPCINFSSGKWENIGHLLEEAGEASQAKKKYISALEAGNDVDDVLYKRWEMGKEFIDVATMVFTILVKEGFSEKEINQLIYEVNKKNHDRNYW